MFLTILLVSRCHYILLTSPDVVDIYAYFQQFNQHTTDSIQSAGAQINKITDIVDVKKKHTSLLLEIFKAIVSVVTSLIPVFLGSGGGRAIATLAGSSIMAAFNAFYDLKTNEDQDSQDIQKDFLDGFLEGQDNTSVVHSLSVMINNSFNTALGVEQSNDTAYNFLQPFADDYTGLLNFTDSGIFSNSQSPISLEDETKTFENLLVTASLDINDYEIQVYPGINPVAIHNDKKSSCPSWASNTCNQVQSQCKDELDKNGRLDALNMCGSFWFSQSQNTSYSVALNNGQGRDSNKVQKVLGALFAQSLTTGALLFENPIICALQRFFHELTEVVYNTSLGGFFFKTGSFQTFENYPAQSFNSSTSFYPIAGNGLSSPNAFVELVGRVRLLDINASVVTPNGFMDQDCFTMLNITFPKEK